MPRQNMAEVLVGYDNADDAGVYQLTPELALDTDERTSLISYRMAVSIGAGIPDAGVILRTEDLLRTLQPELDDFSD